MANPAWFSLYPEATLQSLIAPISDHSPILLSTISRPNRVHRNQFTFDNRWIQEKGFKEVVQKCWMSFHELDICDHLRVTAEILGLWGNKADSEFRVRKKELEKEIKHLQSCNQFSDFDHYRAARTKLSKILVQEETYRRQRAKLF